MSNILLSIIAGGLAGVASCVVLLRFGLVPTAPSGAHTAAGKLATPPTSPVPSSPLIPASDPAPAPDTLSAVLSTLDKRLSPLAEKVSHPRELLDMPEFQAVVTAFRRPDASMTLLGQYALGANWPLACAAFIVLAERPERQSLCDPVLRHLANARPYVLMYAFRFL